MFFPVRTEKSIQGLEEMILHLADEINVKESTIVEIGSWVGASACIFAKYFKLVFCVDPFLPVKDTITSVYNMQNVEKEFKKNISKHTNILHLKHTSKEFLRTLTGRNIDVIYIDGDHHYEAVKKDIEISEPHTKHFLCGHDYTPRFPGVIKAVDEILGKPDKVFSDTSWVKRLKV